MIRVENSRCSDAKSGSGSLAAAAVTVAGLRTNAGEICMSYEWDPLRARRARMIRIATVVVLIVSAVSVPVAALLTATAR